MQSLRSAKNAFYKLRAIAPRSELVKLGFEECSIPLSTFSNCSQSHAAALRCRRPDMPLSGRAKMLFPGDCRACSHLWLQGGCMVFGMGEWKESQLARTVDARATRDIDLPSMEESLDGALEELVRLAGTDLGDFVTFEFAGSRQIMAEDEYSCTRG